MNKIGFIGFGSMGSMLVRGLVQYGGISQNQIIVTRKNRERLVEISNLYPQMQVTEELTEVIRTSKYLFICVKPHQFFEILKNMKPIIQSDQHIISIASSVMFEDMEKLIDCRISKLMPTLTAEINEGITLICHNNKVTVQEAKELEALLHNFMKLKQTRQEDFEFASNLTSCGPGLIAAIFEEMVKSALLYDKFSEAELTMMVQQTLYATAKLMSDRNMEFSTVINRVATKGGITEEGNKVLKEALPDVYNRMFHAISEKRKQVNEKVHQDFADIK